MIEILSIEAEDAFSFRHLEFNFVNGLHKIEGVNGSSKTSVFLALIHCLANKNPKGCKVDDVSNKITGLPYSIKVRARKDGHFYQFINSKKLGKVEVWKDGKQIGFPRIPDNLKLISEILGADFTLLCDLLYQSKDSTLDILETGTDKGRKLFINRVLKLAEIDEQAARMKDREKELAGKNGRIIFLTKQIEMLEASLGQILEEGELRDADSLVQRLSAARAEREELLDKKRHLEAELRNVQKQIATAEAEQVTRQRIETLEEAFIYEPSVSAADLQQELKWRQSEVSRLKCDNVALHTKIQRAEEAQERVRQIEEYQKRLEKIPTPDLDLDECRSRLEAVERTYTTASTKLEEVQKKLRNYRSAAVSKACPTCGSSENWEKISGLVADLEVEEKEHRAIIQKCDLGRRKQQERIRVWSERKQLLYEISKLSAAVPQKFDYGQARRQMAVNTKEITQHELAMVKVEKALTEYHKYKDLQTEIAELRGSLKGVELSEGLYLSEDVAKSDLEMVDNRLAVKSVEIRDISADLEEAKEHNATVNARREVNRQVMANNASIEAQILELKAELADADRRLDLLKEWGGILGDKGFRVARINRFLKSLNHTMASYAQMICDGRIRACFYTNEEGEVEFTISDAAKEMDYVLWSGGEKARVRLVCLFAVLELLEVMGSTSFNVLCLDEVFDQLDVEGKEGLFRVLECLKQKGKAIYVIAHSELALDLSYDTVITAVKHQDGTTQIVQ